MSREKWQHRTAKDSKGIMAHLQSGVDRARQPDSFKIEHRLLVPLLTKLGQVNRGDPQAPSVDDINTMFERPIDRTPRDQEIVLFPQVDTKPKVIDIT